MRISQIPNVSQEQSNGDALWGVLYILILAWMLSSVLLSSNNVYHRRGAFSIARFRLTGQCESLHIVKRADRKVPTFFFYMYGYFFVCVWLGIFIHFIFQTLMKKSIFVLLALMTTLYGFSQNRIEFVLNDSCEFVSKTGDDYIVVEYPNMSAHEIYVELNKRIIRFYNSPKNVTNNIEDQMISIRAYDPELVKFCFWKESKKFTLGKALLTYATAGMNLAYDAIKKGNWDNGDYVIAGFYKIVIEIKDGKIRVESPRIDGLETIAKNGANAVLNVNLNNLSYKNAIMINKDEAVSTRKGTKEKAEKANEKKKKNLEDAVAHINALYNTFTDIKKSDW